MSDMPVERVFQKHVIDGSSYFFRGWAAEQNGEYSLRHDLADSTGCSINDVVIIGSGKMGFSLKSENFLAFDHLFTTSGNPRDKSDIDVALVNRRFFESTAERVFHLSRHFDREWAAQNWTTNQFYRQPSDLSAKYFKYLARGWLRPDYLPRLYFDDAEWRPICDAWFRTLSRKITIGIYSDWTYLKHYHMDNLVRLKSRIYLGSGV
jgi:hypothetical protein